MPAPTSYSNGALLQGTRKITIGARDFIATDVKVSSPTREKVVYDENNLPLGAIQANDFSRLSATFIGRSAVTAPERNETFTYDSVDYVITSVETGAAELDVVKYAIAAREVVGE